MIFEKEILIVWEYKLFFVVLKVVRLVNYTYQKLNSFGK